VSATEEQLRECMASDDFPWAVDLSAAGEASENTDIYVMPDPR
jgi:hypothetical protein